MPSLTPDEQQVLDIIVKIDSGDRGARRALRDRRKRMPGGGHMALSGALRAFVTTHRRGPHNLEDLGGQVAGILSELPPPDASPVADPVAPVVADPVAPVVADPAAPVVADPVAPVVADPVAPVVADPVAAEAFITAVWNGSGDAGVRLLGNAVKRHQDRRRKGKHEVTHVAR